jgi:dTDP-4-amino-4,6-dideoxygalactose transaminase
MPLLPFTRPDIDEETIAAVGDVLRSGWITSGPQMKAFEAELGAYCGGRTVRSFSSATIAMEIALRLARVKAGDEVITTPLSWVATANVVLEVGARPVFVDIDPATRNIDLDRAAAAVTPATRAIIPVDLAGLPVDRVRLAALATRHGLRVIEDAAQSFGASWQGRRIGTTGDFVCFSFHANKNITCAEGGAIVLPDAALATECELWRLQGVRRFGEDGMDVEFPGGKANLTDVAACIGRGQLKRLGEFTARRRALARRYFELLGELLDPGVGVQLPLADFTHSNWHMFQVVLPAEADRGRFIRAMRNEEIAIGVHYPAMHLFTLYRQMGYRPGQFPHAERAGRSMVTLPLFPRMTEDDVARVCRALPGALAEARA